MGNARAQEGLGHRWKKISQELESRVKQPWIVGYWASGQLSETTPPPQVESLL